MVAFFFSLYHAADKFNEFVVGRAAAHEFVQIVVPD
jgi:hypothetical protein